METVKTEQLEEAEGGSRARIREAPCKIMAETGEKRASESSYLGGNGGIVRKKA